LNVFFFSCWESVSLPRAEKEAAIVGEVCKALGLERAADQCRLSDIVKEDVRALAPSQVNRSKRKPTASAVLEDGSLVEMLFRPSERRTLLCVWNNDRIQELESVSNRGEILVPYAPTNNLLAHEVILFPSEAAEAGSADELVADIRRFIHSYIDVSALFEQIASYYVMFSWLYDSFNELPYLRLRGDTGSGKTRCLLAIGSLCYKPIFASGASSVSPIFRILDSFRGTLIVDEGDFRFSDEKAEIIKILNNGNARGFPVLRSESVNNREFDPRAFAVFGPKIIATRNPFEDRALESRCLTEETGTRKLREDIPLNLGPDWKRQAQELRNRLLMFRFLNFGKRQIDSTLIDRRIEPRLAQLFGPLLAVIDDPATKQNLLELAREYHRELLLDRSTDTEAEVLEVIRDLSQTNPDDRPLSVREVTTLFAERHSGDVDRRITPKWIGGVIRQSLRLKTYKSHGVFVIASDKKPLLERLCDRYGIGVDSASGDLGDLKTLNGG
jgi:hypothetical protein